VTEALLSESPKRALKLEYQSDGKSVTILWERLHFKSILQTVFDGHGGILDQKVITPDKPLGEFVDSFAKNESFSIKKTAYKEVSLSKNCPSCGSKNLVRYAEHLSNPKDIPVMPIYLCTKCRSKSYYLTDGYLNRLVSEHPGLFSEGELSVLNENSRAFAQELKEYIVRFFAAKKVLNIK